MFAVIVASHIRLRAMITVLHRDAEHRGEGRDDHRSRPDARSFIETAWFREKGLPRRDEGVARLYSRHLYEYVCI